MGLPRIIITVAALAFVGVSTSPRGVGAQPNPAAPKDPAAPNADPAPAAPPAPLASLEVQKILFSGNRKVEDDAIRVNLRTQRGLALTQDLLRDDVKAIWRMGFFEDVQVETTNVPGGVNVVFVVKEKPSIRKIYVSGHDELGLTKVNEVLDIKKEQILDLAKIKKNVEKIREQYVQRGFYMAEVNYELRREAPGEVDVYFRVRANAKVEVRRINFVGNVGATDAELRDVMLTQQSDLFSFVSSSGTYREDMFQRDVFALQAFYQDRGYINVKIGQPKLELSPDKRALFIAIAIEEGLQYKLASLDIKGDLLLDKKDLLAAMQSEVGKYFNRTRLTQDRSAIEDLYKDKGFAFVNVVPLNATDEKNRLVHITFEIGKGKEVTIERINIRGNSKTRDKVVRREMRVYEGELYSQSKLDFSKRRVNQLGFFDRVDLNTEQRGDDRMDVNVEVGERQTGAFQIGAGFSSYESFIFQAQISQQNLLGRGQSLSLQAMLSGLRQLFLLSFEEPYFLDTQWTFGFNLFNQFQYYPSFQRTSRGASLTWGYWLLDDLRFFVRYQLEEVSVSNSSRSAFFAGGQRTPFPSGTLANLLRPGFTSSVRMSLAYDTRDNRMFTKKGWYNTASFEIADDFLLSKTRFTRYDITSRYFYPLWGPFVLRLKGEWGLITSRDPQGVPIFERYFVGGIYDVRGFRPYSLGPKIRAPVDQTPESSLLDRTIGGNMQVVGKAEIEFPLIEKVGIRAVVFTDFGNSYNMEQQYCRLRPYNSHASIDPCNKLLPLESLRASWGFGFRWFSPIGPLRFEWGIPFAPLRYEDSIIFEFTIGNDL